MRLQDGTELAILEVKTETATLDVKPGDKRDDRTMYVDYTTQLPIRNYVALVSQVSQLWSHYREDAERGGATALMITAHGASQSDPPASFAFLIDDDGKWAKPEVHTLRTGKQVVVISCVSDHDGALFIDYVTDLSLESGADLCDLAPEVLDVWSEFCALAEELSVQKAFVCPNSAPLGGSLISFSFTRGKSGGWGHDWPDCP